MAQRSAEGDIGSAEAKAVAGAETEAKAPSPATTAADGATSRTPDAAPSLRIARGGNTRRSSLRRSRALVTHVEGQEEAEEDEKEEEEGKGEDDGQTAGALDEADHPLAQVQDQVRQMG